eukprot:gene47404-63546_t
MRIAPNYSCNSLTSQYIAEGLCLGQSSCKLTADTNVLYTWPITTSTSTSTTRLPAQERLEAGRLVHLTQRQN